MASSVWNKFNKPIYKILIKPCCKLVFDEREMKSVREKETWMFKIKEMRKWNFVQECIYHLSGMSWA